MRRVRPIFGLRRERPHSGTAPILLPSRAASERHLLDLREALEAVRRDEMPEMHCLVWPEGLGRSVLPRMQLAVRTRNAFNATGLTEGDSALTVRDLLGLQNFGRKSLMDLLLGLESFLRECIRNRASIPDQIGNETEGTSPQRQDVYPPSAPQPNSPWERAGNLLASILAAGAELYGTRSLASALHPDLVRLASRMGVSSDLEAVPLQELVDGTGGLASVASARLATVLETLSMAEHAIVEHRILRAPAKTLEEIGSEVGVTRERIRQLQKKLEWKVQVALMKELDVLAEVLKDQYGHLVADRQLEDRIQILLPSAPPMATRVFRQALIDKMGYTLHGGVYFDDHVNEVVEQLTSLARRIADDVGLVEEEQLIAALPSPDWCQVWPWIRDRCGWHDLFGQLGLRASSKAQAKAALLSIGRPATREEIGRLCGLSETRVGAYLSTVPSVVRADKERWGLKEWIDDEYDGIVGEIIQRIEEDGGTTTTERLLRELPSKFKVSPASVRSFMQTPKFVIRDGWISLASASTLQLRDLEDVIHGRDRTGDPYWTFVVDSRFLEGYSLTGVPPEFAKALGCEPDERGVSSGRELGWLP